MRIPDCYLPEVETATPEAWADYQEELLRTALEHAAKARELPRRLAEAGIELAEIRGVRDLASIPVLSKDALPALQAEDPPFGGLTAAKVHDLKRIYMSPGPIFDPEGDGPDYWRWGAALWAAGFRPGHVVYNTFSYHLTPAGAMMEEGLWAVGATVVPGGVGHSDSQVDFLARVEAHGYTGTPDFLHTLVTRAAEKGLELALERAFVSGGPLFPAVRAALENDHGLGVFQGYGTADVGAIGYECEQHDGWHLAPGAVVEVVDPATGRPADAGETGEVVVSLPEAVYPLVRFGTGDLSALDFRPCPCGRTTPRLLGWQGRRGDGVKVRGMFVHAHQLARLFETLRGVERYQAIVELDEAHKDRLVVRVAGEGAELRAAEITARLQDALKVRPIVEIVDVEQIAEDAAPLLDARSRKEE